MDTHGQIARYVHEVERLKSDIDEHWSKIRAAIEGNHPDVAVPLLKAYFRLKQSLSSVEVQLAGYVSANY